MSSIIPYPRSLSGPAATRMRFTAPPSFVGSIDRSNVVPLATVLENRMCRFSMSREFAGHGTVRIDLSKEGTRQVITGRRIWPTSLYPSRKCGAPIACEGSNELLFAYHCEVDPGVVGYATQAAHFQVQVDGRTQNYHADFIRNRADGGVEVIEIKSNADYVRKPKYVAKLKAVRDLCKVIGWQFRTTFGEDLRCSTYFNFHVSQIHACRFYRVPPPIEDVILDCLWSAHSAVTVADLTPLCGNIQQARTALFALACRSIVHFDLTKPICPQTAVHLVKGSGK